jgi:hypothetical protein
LFKLDELVVGVEQLGVDAPDLYAVFDGVSDKNRCEKWSNDDVGDSGRL